MLSYGVKVWTTLNTIGKDQKEKKKDQRPRLENNYLFKQGKWRTWEDGIKKDGWCS